MVWHPNVTVAAVIEQDGRFLLVEEEIRGQRVLNQPAGHLEPDESLVQAVVRETLEETAHYLEVDALLGVYRWLNPHRDTTYLRFAFCGRSLGRDATRSLDEGIVRALWLSVGELRASGTPHRSPQVIRCIEDYLAGQRIPLYCLHDLEPAPP